MTIMLDDKKTNNTAKNLHNEVGIISKELHEQTRKDGLKRLDDPKIKAVFMRLKDK